jgi:CDK-activating kinase assembly factor MAT1
LIFVLVAFNLVNDSDVPETEERIAKYKRENQDNISKNNFKSVRETQAFKSYIDQEKIRRKRMRDEVKRRLETESETKQNLKESILNELVSFRQFNFKTGS